jgi:hypothetical protein
MTDRMIREARRVSLRDTKVFDVSVYDTVPRATTENEIYAYIKDYLDKLSKTQLRKDSVMKGDSEGLRLDKANKTCRGNYDTKKSKAKDRHTNGARQIQSLLKIQAQNSETTPQVITPKKKVIKGQRRSLWDELLETGTQSQMLFKGPPVPLSQTELKLSEDLT